MVHRQVGIQHMPASRFNAARPHRADLVSGKSGRAPLLSKKIHYVTERQRVIQQQGEAHAADVACVPLPAHISGTLVAAAFATLATVLLPSTAARAQSLSVSLASLPKGLDPVLVAQISIALTLLVLIIVMVSLLSRARRQIVALRRGQEIIARQSTKRVDELEALLESDDQRLVIWQPGLTMPQLYGALPKAAQAPADKSHFLAFGNWLRVQDAQDLGHAIDKLRTSGQSFLETVETLQGSFLEVSGRTSGGRALVRFRDLTVDRSKSAALKSDHEDMSKRFEIIRQALAATCVPIWQRDAEGRLTWVNSAYRTAVDAGEQRPLYELPKSLLETSERQKLMAVADDKGLASGTFPVVVNGDRRIFQVTEITKAYGSAGIALDVTEVDRAKAALKRTEDFHTSTLDQLATAVAIFSSDQRLRSYNNAYQTLWGLDPAFLDSRPDDTTILERLRAQRRLPEQVDFHVWKADIFDVYHSMDGKEHWWHLPDGKTLRVLANPHPQGGVTYIYENITEQISLESRYNALIRVQGETLDHLSEAVAVYGPDGLLRLWNPAFSQMWQIEPKLLNEQPHVSGVINLCQRLHPVPGLWSDYIAAVTGLVETREDTTSRIERLDNMIIDVATIPLPDGSTLSTFVDLTDSVNVERALTEKNQALQAADDLKNAFIQNVSYELRSPLTNIIGFAQLLADPMIGKLNEKQAEYTGYIRSSSSSLLTIINDILDLATIDAGGMELTLGTVDVRDIIRSAIEALQDRIHEAQIEVQIEVEASVGTLIADERRLLQIIYNLVANAVSYSDDGGAVTIACDQSAEFMRLIVADTGCGISSEVIASVFERFEGRSSGGRRRGAGLGLSIVHSFVELHGGRIEIDSTINVGTRVTCFLPLTPKPNA